MDEKDLFWNKQGDTDYDDYDNVMELIIGTISIILIFFQMWLLASLLFFFTIPALSSPPQQKKTFFLWRVFTRDLFDSKLTA